MANLDTDKSNPQMDDIWGGGMGNSSSPDGLVDPFGDPIGQDATGGDIFADMGLPNDSAELGVSDTSVDPFGDFGKTDDNVTSSDTDDSKKYWAEQASYMPDQTNSSENPIQEGSVGKVKLGYKSVGLIISLCFIILAGVFMMLGRVRKKPNQVPVTPTSAPVASIQPTTVPIRPSDDVDNTVDEGDIVLNKMPDSMSLNYNVEVLPHDGVVVSKDRYIQGSQIIYCLGIELDFAVVKQTVYFYCSYTAYNRTKMGERLNVKYQQPVDGYISISEVSWQ